MRSGLNHKSGKSSASGKSRSSLEGRTLRKRESTCVALQDSLEMVDLKKISIFPSEQGKVQAKVRVNTPGDKYEQEADRVAAEIIQRKGASEKVENGGKQQEVFPVSHLSMDISSSGHPLKGRKHKTDEDQLQAKELPVRIPKVTPGISKQTQHIGGKGKPLPEASRSFFEPKFGIDLRKVRIHDGKEAEIMAEGINAQAFTIGTDIVFGKGQYNPGSIEGKKLIAHELTHVLQQTSPGFHAGTSNAIAIQRKGGTFGGFFVNIGRAIASIFVDEPDFDDQTIEDYLKVLDAGDIEDDYISDDKARMVVKRWKAGTLKLNYLRKELLIREMFSGPTLNADEQAILDILKGSPGDLTYLFTKIKPKEFREEFHGDEYDELDKILIAWEERTGKAKPVKAKTKPATKHNLLTLLGDDFITKFAKELLGAIGKVIPENKGLTLSEFEQYISQQADWFAEPTLQKDDKIRNQLWEAAFLLAEGDHISSALGKIYLSEFMGMSPDERKALLAYAEGTRKAAKTVRIKKPHADFEKVVRLGKAMKELATFVPGQVLKVVIEQKTLEKIEAEGLVPEFKKYYQDFSPTLEHPREGKFLLELLREGLAPYQSLKGWVRDLHAVTSATRIKLAANVGDKSRSKPVLLVLMSSIDHNSAFLQWDNLEKAVKNSKNLALLLQGEETISDVTARVNKIADDYGQIPSAGAKPQLGQVVIAGHGSSISVQLAASSTMTSGQNDKNVTYVQERLKPLKAGDDSEKLIDTILSRLDPKDARVVFAGCLVGSHKIPLSTQLSDKKKAAKNINEAIKNNPNLRDRVNDRMKALGITGGTVEAANASTVANTLNLDSQGKARLNLSWDPDIGGTKANYVRTGAEPKGALRAALETYADPKLGPEWTTNEMKRHISEQSTETHWWKVITRTAFQIVINHSGKVVDPAFMNELVFRVGDWFHAGWEKEADVGGLVKSVKTGEASIVYQAMLNSSRKNWRHMKVTVYQAWMQVDGSKTKDFMTAVGSHRLLGSRLNKLLDLSLIKPHLSKLLKTSDPTKPAPEQVKLAITIAQFQGSNMPAPVKTFLKNAVGNKTMASFPPALGVQAFLEGASELSILRSLGLAPGIKAPESSPKPAKETKGGPKKAPSNLPDANADLKGGDDVNESLVDIKAQKVTLPADSPVFSKPDPNSKVLATLNKGETIRVAGKVSGWVLIDFKGNPAYVDLTLLS